MAHAILAAEALTRKLNIEILSAGVDDYGGCLADRLARQICDVHGSPMPKFIATYVGDLDLSQAIRILVMEQRHAVRLQERFQVPAERVSLLGEFDPQQRGLEIDDPIGTDFEVFDACYVRMRDCIRHYLETTRDLL